MLFEVVHPKLSVWIGRIGEPTILSNASVSLTSNKTPRDIAIPIRAHVRDKYVVSVGFFVVAPKEVHAVWNRDTR